MQTPQSIIESIKSDKELRSKLSDFVQRVLEENIDIENSGEADSSCDECSYEECYNYDDECECECHKEFNGYVEESRSVIVNYIFNLFIPNHIIPKVAPNDTES